MAREHTTERTEFNQFAQANSGSTNSSSVENQHLYNVNSQPETAETGVVSQIEMIHHSEQVFAIGFLITTWVPFLERPSPLSGR